MHPLVKLYGKQSPEFIRGFIAAIEWYATQGRIELRLYGRPVTREVVQLEKQSILDGFTGHEEEIEL